MAENYTESLIFTKNLDEKGTPFIPKLVEVAKVSENGRVQCKQNVYKKNGITIISPDGLRKVSKPEQLLEVTGAYFIYEDRGEVLFSEDLIGETVAFEYYGTGNPNIGDCRVFTTVDNNGNITETLNDIIRDSREIIESIKLLGGGIVILNKLEEVIENAETLNTALGIKITVGTEVSERLEEDINTGNELDSRLKSTITKGESVNSTLNSTINTGNSTNQDLIGTINSAKTTDTALKQTIASGNQLKDEVADVVEDMATVAESINQSANKVCLINSTDWQLNSSTNRYEYTWTHGMDKNNLIFEYQTVKNGKRCSYFMDYEHQDSNATKFITETNDTVYVIATARYYTGLALHESNFEVDNMVDGVNKVVMTKAERDLLASHSSQLEQIVYEEEKKSSTLKTINISDFVNTLNTLSGGGTLILPKNTELIIENTLKIENLKNVKIVGSGNNYIKIKDGQKITGIEFKNCDNLILENIYFDGQGTLTNITDYGNYFLDLNIGVKNITINKCTFKNITDVCILDRNQDTNPNDGTIIGGNVLVKMGNTIITNNRFENCKHSYLTKGGGVKNVIYSNNFHNNCYTGVKIDGEVINGGIHDDTNGDCGNVLISNNIFENMGGTLCAGAGLNCIMIEERVNNVVISNNIINNTNYLNAICISTGQTCSYVKNVSILNNNIRNIKNGNAILIGEWNWSVGKDATFVNFEIKNNLINAIDYSGIQINVPNVPTTGIVIQGNKFKDVSLTSYNGGIKLIGNIENLEIIDNVFLVNSAIPDTRQLLFSNLRNAKARIVVNGNVFKCDIFNDGQETYKEMVTIENCGVIIFTNNNIVRGKILLQGSDFQCMYNNFEDTQIFLDKKDTNTSKLWCLYNVFNMIKTTPTYCIRVGDGYAYHVIQNNTYSKKITTPVYNASGGYTDL